jgi:uncharacterized protein YjdB
MGAQLVYAWTDARNGVDRDIYAGRVDTSGTLVDGGGVAITTAAKDQLTPDVASSGAEALVVWSDRGAGNFDILGAVLGAGGTVTVPPFVICNAPGDQSRPSVTYDAADAQYLVAWVDARGGSTRDIYAARVTAAGSVLDANGVGVATGGTRFSPRLATSGGTVLAVYEDRRNGNSDIYATRLTAGASLGVVDASGFPITTDASDQVQPVVAVATAGFVVVWSDARSAATSGNDIYAQIVGSGGLVGGNFVVSADLENETTPSVVDASATGVLVSYAKQRTDLDAPRVVMRILDSAPSLVSISVTPPSATLPKGTTQQLQATGTYSDGSTQDITSQATWTSANAGIAAVDANGLVTAAGVGSATVTATLAGQSGSADITVTPPLLVSIAVTPANQTIPKGTTLAFTATGTYSDGSAQNLTASVTWASSSPTVAPIDVTGLATAASLGTTSISATLGTISSSTNLTVGPAALVLIGLTPDSPSIAKGSSQTFVATGVYTDGSTQNLTVSASWSSSVTTVATIVAPGVASGGGQGTTTITATVGTVSGSTTLTVTAATLQSIDILPVDPSVPKGTKVSFTALGTYSDGTVQDITTQVTWSSSSPSVAPITSQGVATALSPGTTNITATRGTVSDTSQLTVSSATLSSIAVTPATATIAVTTQKQFTATGTYSDGTSLDLTTQVTWSTGSSGIATVSNTVGFQGLATGTGAGTTSVTATSGAISGSASLTVDAVTLVSIAVTPVNPQVPVGMKQQMKATGTFSDGSSQDLTAQATWTSSAINVATISNAAGSRGLASVIKVGGTTITATFGGVSGSTLLTGKNVVLVSIAVMPSTLTISVGQQSQLNAIGTFNDGSTLDITTQVGWHTAKKKTASVSATGRVTGVKAGSTTITAKKGAITGSASVTVQ